MVSKSPIPKERRNVAPGQLRTVETPAGVFTYTLTRKRVKNLNLRVRTDGTVALSVPYGCPDSRADQMVREKWEWITSVRARQNMPAPDLSALPSREECRRLLSEAVERVCPLVEPLGVAMPEVKVRKLRSQWGNCHWRQGYITLNLALARCPEYLRDYVALHELLHFFHHDHGQGFYAAMDALMPDWRERRGELKHYRTALNWTKE